MRRTIVVFFGLMFAQAAAAQVNPSTPRIPEITSSGRGEVPITPDRATVLISVESRASSAAAAATETNDTIARVLDALRRSGLSQSDITTAAYTVGEDPRTMRMMSPAAPTPPTRAPEFLARNSVRANVHRPADVGKIIDAALAAGATSITSVQFSSPSTDEARRQAISIAVAQAQRDAEAIARAAGGSLGRLLSMSSTPIPIASDFVPSDTYFSAVAGGSAGFYPTMINPRDLTVVVSVFGRWEFVPGSR